MNAYVEFVQNRLAQHRRLYMHVRNGGQVNAQIDGGRISAMITDIENLLIMCQDLERTADNLSRDNERLCEQNNNQKDLIEAMSKFLNAEEIEL